MKHYGAQVFDFTPNLTTGQIDFSVFPVDWRDKLRVRRVYSQKVVSLYKTHQSFSTSGWADPSISVPSWYTIYDAAYTPTILSTQGGYVGTGHDTQNNIYYGRQTHFVFDTSFIGANSLVAAATLTCTTKDENIPRSYVLCGTGVYCNFYVSNVEYIHTRHQGMPVNLPVDGSGYVARFGPYPARSPNNAGPRSDGYNSYDTAVLDPSAVNKVGLTTLTALTSDFFTMNAGVRRFIFANIQCAWITVYYASL